MQQVHLFNNNKNIPVRVGTSYKCTSAVSKIISPSFGDFLSKSHGINIIKCRMYIFYLLLKVAQADLEKGMLD